MKGRREEPSSPSTSRLQRALATHGTRGLPFALARRMIIVLEDRINPRHVNHFDLGYSTVFPNGSDPMAAIYSAEFQQVVIELPLSSLRWSRMGLRLDDPAANPFVQTVMQYHAGEVEHYGDSALKRYFDSWHPESGAAVLGLNGEDAGPIGSQPAQAVALPWAAEAGTLDPAWRLDRVDRWNRAESRSTGVELSVDHGHKHYGPVTDLLGLSELRRYVSLTDSVAQRGFLAKVPEGYIGAQILVDADSWAAVLTGPGLHRAVVAAALGVDPLTVAIDKNPPLVHRSDCESWPGVRCGLFTRDSALGVFDRMLAGEPPSSFPACRSES